MRTDTSGIWVAVEEAEEEREAAYAATDDGDAEGLRCSCVDVAIAIPRKSALFNLVFTPRRPKRKPLPKSL